MERIAQDLRYGVRTLTRAPVVTTVAIATLVLGVGVNLAIFSIVDRGAQRWNVGARAQGSH